MPDPEVVHTMDDSWKYARLRDVMNARDAWRAEVETSTRKLLGKYEEIIDSMLEGRAAARLKPPADGGERP